MYVCVCLFVCPCESIGKFGFRPGISTEDAVIKLTESITDKIDKKVKCFGIFLDLSKAFDTVSVPLLLKKMEQIGIRGLPLKMFTSYLENRTQTVKIDSYTSDVENVTYGIPQGSVLGPTMFLIYVNDLCSLPLKFSEVFSYADDTALVVYGKDWNTAKFNAEIALERVSDWLRENLLTLNTDKSLVVPFCSSPSSMPPSFLSPPKIHSCQNPSNCVCPTLSSVLVTKYLGVYIDAHLTWRPHLNIIKKRVRSLLYVFKNLRNSADACVLKLVYHALCQSILTYCIPVWGGAAKTYMLELERAQRAVLKVMCRKPIRYPTHQLYQDCAVLSVRKLFILRVILRKHLSLPLDKAVLLKRKGMPVCPTQPARTLLASRQFNTLSSRLYNKINKITPIYALNSLDVN